jgi:cytochrome bd-type quinol oxidase subunit 2
MSLITLKRTFASLFLLIFLSIFPLQIEASNWLDRANEGGLNSIGTTAYNETSSPEPLQMIVARIIKIFLGLLGIIFVILILVAGFKYMTAGGNEEKVKQSVAQIRNAIIGLFIIIAAYSITIFITNSLSEAVTNR